MGTTIIQSIQNKIYEIRGIRIMLDYDLAALYETETKAVNQAVKRNIKRFPPDFMFRLTPIEWQIMRSQIVTASDEMSTRLKRVEVQAKRNLTQTPYAFTEQGVAMLSGVLSSDKAIMMNIEIMRAFIEIRKIFLQHQNFQLQLNEVKNQLENHDLQLNHLYDAMENLLDEKAAQRKWEERDRIGFGQ